MINLEDLEKFPLKVLSSYVLGAKKIKHHPINLFLSFANLDNKGYSISKLMSIKAGLMANGCFYDSL